MQRCMDDGWMNIWINRCMEGGRKGEGRAGEEGMGGWTDSYMNAWNNGRSVHAWMGRCVGGWMGGCMDGWIADGVCSSNSQLGEPHHSSRVRVKTNKITNKKNNRRANKTNKTK